MTVLSGYVDKIFHSIPAPLVRTRLEAREEPLSKAKAPVSAAFKKLKVRVRYAHGILMGISFLGFYPFAALLLRVGNFRYVMWAHVGLQIFAMLIMYAGLGAGIWFAKADGSLYDADTQYLKAHTYIGTIVPALMIFQPMLGYLHHRGFVKTGARSVFTFAHKYYGRTVILAGAINGIVGRENEGTDYAHGRTIYSSLFGVVLGIYVIVVGVTAYTKRRKNAVVEATSPTSTDRPITTSYVDHEKEV
jgi:hypothetical protein